LEVQSPGDGAVQAPGQGADLWLPEEAAWEHDLKRLELGYEDEGFYNYKLQLEQVTRVMARRAVSLTLTLLLLEISYFKLPSRLLQGH
jgi:hypothetical protein